MDGCKRKGAPHPKVGCLLRAFREGLGWAEDELAQVLGVSQAVVITYEGRMKGQPHAVPPLAYLHKVNVLKRALKKGLLTKEMLVADGQAKQMVMDGLAVDAVSVRIRP